jgi:hypothetical protein
MRLTREGTRILEKYQVAKRAAEFEAKTPPSARTTMHSGWTVVSEPIDWKQLELCSLSIRRAIDEVANVEDIDDEDHRVWVSENRAWLFEQFELKDEPPTLQDLEEFKLKRTKQELLNRITQLEREQKGLPPDDSGLTPEHRAEVRKAFGLPAKEPPKPNPFWVAENYVRTKLDKKQDWVEKITQLVSEQEDLPPSDPLREYQLETRRALGLRDNKPVPPPPPEPPFTEEGKAAIRAEVEADAKRKGIPLYDALQPKPEPKYMSGAEEIKSIKATYATGSMWFWIGVIVFLGIIIYSVQHHSVSDGYWSTPSIIYIR